MTFEERIAALEQQAAANQLPTTFAVLQRKLEQDWQPDAAVLLQPGSANAALVGISRGIGSATWTASGTSADVTIPHGLGTYPVSAGAYPINVTGLGFSIMSWNQTNIVVRGFGTAGGTFSGTFNFAWHAIK